MREGAEQSLHTLQFLYCLSKHLSSRKDCSNVNYTVTITDTNVYLHPSIHVFPNRFIRKPECRINVVDHIILSHFRDTLYDHSDVNVQIKYRSLVPGTYKYQSSLYNKRRRWMKLK